MTRFFIPGNSPTRSEEIYDWIVRYVKAMLDCQIDPVRIFSLDYRHEGKVLRATVGEIEPRTGQLVIAILRGETYLICTPYYGVNRGEPMPVGLSDAGEIQYFEGLGNARERLKSAVESLDADADPGKRRLRNAATWLGRVTIGDFPPVLAGDYLSLKHRLTWHGEDETIDEMAEGDVEAAAASIRSLYVDVLAYAHDDGPAQ